MLQFSYMANFLKITVFLFFLLYISGETAVYSAVPQQNSKDSNLIVHYEHLGIKGNVVATSNDPDLEPGFPIQTLHTAGTYMGMTALNTRVGNIDADPQLEILVTGLAQGPLYAFNYDGTSVPGWPVKYYNRAFYTSLGNLSNESPELEIFTGQFVGRAPETPPGPMMAYSGSGQLLSGWPKDSEYLLGDIRKSASLADFDGDGLDEIVIYEGSPNIYAYRADGTLLPGWPIKGEDSIHAISDLDGDGDLEIVTVVNRTSNGVEFVAYHHDGSQVDNFLVHLSSYSSSPVIGDVDGDGSPEVVVLGYARCPDGCPFSVIIISPTKNGIYGTNIKRLIPACPISGECYVGYGSELALADMDGDGIPEIIAGLSEGITVWKGNGTLLPGFPVTWGPPFNISYFYAPVVGDIDGDQKPDIVVITPEKVYVYNSEGLLNPHFPKSLPIELGAVPAIADIDMDGRNELIVTSNYWDGYSGYKDKIWAYDLGGDKHGKVEWRQQGGGPQNWGAYPAPPTYSGSNLYLLNPGFLGTPPIETISIPLKYGNKGVTIASSVTLTATMDSNLTYIGDTSGISPTINGQTIVWMLPNLGYLVSKNFMLDVQLPSDANYGDSYSISFELTSNSPEAIPSDNFGQTIVAVARQVFLPLVKK